MTTPLLSLSSVACTRGGLTILSNVAFTLSEGQALILRGPNGSGKTTLLRTIAGLQPPAAGQIDASPDSIAYAAHADGMLHIDLMREIPEALKPRRIAIAKQDEAEKDVVDAKAVN